MNLVEFPGVFAKDLGRKPTKWSSTNLNGRFSSGITGYGQRSFLTKVNHGWAPLVPSNFLDVPKTGFTIEFWYHQNENITSGQRVDTTKDASTTPFVLYTAENNLNSNYFRIFWNTTRLSRNGKCDMLTNKDGKETHYDYAEDLSTNGGFKFQHVAITYDNSVFAVFINGEKKITFNNPFGTITKILPAFNCQAENTEVLCHITEIRISDTVRYTENFDPDRLGRFGFGEQYIISLRTDNGSIEDECKNTWTTVGNVKIEGYDPIERKNNLHIKSGGYIKATIPKDFLPINTDSRTVEFWMYFVPKKDNPSNDYTLDTWDYSSIFCYGENDGDQTHHYDWGLMFQKSNNVFYLAQINCCGDVNYKINQSDIEGWHHYAVVMKDAVTNIFLDGKKIMTNTNPCQATRNTFYIGSEKTKDGETNIHTNRFDLHFYNFTFSNVAKYTSDFTISRLHANRRYPVIAIQNDQYRLYEAYPAKYSPQMMAIESDGQLFYTIDNPTLFLGARMDARDEIAGTTPYGWSMMKGKPAWGGTADGKGLGLKYIGFLSYNHPIPVSKNHKFDIQFTWWYINPNNADWDNIFCLGKHATEGEFKDIMHLQITFAWSSSAFSDNPCVLRVEKPELGTKINFRISYDNGVFCFYQNGICKKTTKLTTEEGDTYFVDGFYFNGSGKTQYRMNGISDIIVRTWDQSYLPPAHD